MSRGDKRAFRRRGDPGPETQASESRTVERLYDFITATPAADIEGSRAWMLGTVLSLTFPLLVASLGTFVTATTIMMLTGRTWPIAWVVADWGVTALRLRLIRTLKTDQASPTLRNRRHGFLMMGGLAWVTLFGAGCGGAIATGHPALMVLSALNIAAAAATIAMRNASTPRFGMLVMALGIVPFEIGLLLAPVPQMTIIAVLIPLLGVALSSILFQATDLLVRTFRAEHALHVLTRTDPLTGLANRIHLDETLTSLLAPRRDGPAPLLSVICLDLDGFKAINDGEGHASGDALLRTVAERLRHTTRDGDEVFRLGGDEFVCTLPGADAREVRIVAERLIAAIGQSVDLGDGRSVSVGVSIGGATSGPGRGSASALLLQADAALYAAKRSGKNRYVASVPNGRGGPVRRNPDGEGPLRISA